MTFDIQLPDKRLGKGGAEEVKSCPYLKDVKWEDVRDRKMPPPLIPEIIGNEQSSINLGHLLSKMTRSVISEEQQKFFEHFSSALNLGDSEENSVEY